MTGRLNKNMKKLYVIIEHDFKDEGYSDCVVDGLAFENAKTAMEYRNIKPSNSSMSVEELILYPEE